MWAGSTTVYEAPSLRILKCHKGTLVYSKYPCIFSNNSTVSTACVDSSAEPQMPDGKVGERGPEWFPRDHHSGDTGNLSQHPFYNTLRASVGRSKIIY